MIFQNIRSKKNMKQTTDLSMQTVFPHGTELQGLGSDVSLPACLVVGDFMVVLVLKGGALWNLCSKPKLIKSRTQTKKKNTSPPQAFQSLPGLPKICATLASLLPWSKGFGLWQGLGRRANTSLEALNKTTKMIHSLQNMFEIKLTIHNDWNEVMFEVSMVKTLLTLVNTSSSSSFELVCGRYSRVWKIWKN